MLETVARAIHNALTDEFSGLVWYFHTEGESRLFRPPAPELVEWGDVPWDTDWRLKLEYKADHVDIVYPTPIQMTFSYAKKGEDIRKHDLNELRIPTTIKKVMYSDPNMFDSLQSYMRGAVEHENEIKVLFDMDDFMKQADLLLKAKDNGIDVETSFAIVGRRGTKIIDIDP